MDGGWKEVMLVRSDGLVVRYGFGDHRVPYAGKATDLYPSIRSASKAENENRPLCDRTLGAEWNLKAL